MRKIQMPVKFHFENVGLIVILIRDENKVGIRWKYFSADSIFQYQLVNGNRTNVGVPEGLFPLFKDWR